MGDEEDKIFEDGFDQEGRLRAYRQLAGGDG